jgi:hypothetical protein
MVAALRITLWGLRGRAVRLKAVHDVTQQSDHREHEQRVREYIQHRVPPKNSCPHQERLKRLSILE